MLKKLDLKSAMTVIVIATLCVLTFAKNGYDDIYKMVCTSIVTYYFTRAKGGNNGDLES